MKESHEVNEEKRMRHNVEEKENNAFTCCLCFRSIELAKMTDSIKKI